MYKNREVITIAHRQDVKSKKYLYGMLPPKLQKKLEIRSEKDAMRVLSSKKELVDLASNDYLGLSKLPELANIAASLLASHDEHSHGAGGSRLLTGNHPLYAVCEAAVAQYHGQASALLFNSGYDANIGLFQSVPQRGDIILYDAYIHASIRDGIQMSHARAYKFEHNDLEDLEKQCERAKTTLDKNGQLYIVTESVFSMDGDSPDLKAMIDLGEAYQGLLIVDEAHATGVIGEKGRGMVKQLGLENRVFATLVTFGKAMGVHGAAVLCASELKVYLINYARSLIYTTALPAHSVAMIMAAYTYLDTHSSDVAVIDHLRQYITYFRQLIETYGLSSYFITSHSAIQVAVIPGVSRVKTLSRKLEQHGFDVRAILSPTVAEGQERLRFCLHSFNHPKEFQQALRIVVTALEK